MILTKTEVTEAMRFTLLPGRRHKFGLRVRLIVFICVGLLGCVLDTSASAGQFAELSHAKYVFVGFVNEAKAEPIAVRATSEKDVIVDSFESHVGEQGRGKLKHYVVASVSIERNIIGASSLQKDGNISICAGKKIAVGLTYLFIVGDSATAEHGCWPAVSFLLGALPSGAPNSSIVLTEEVLEMMPPTPRLDQYALVLGDASIKQSDCPHNEVILDTYFNLQDFVDLLKQERSKWERDEQVTK